ncbi:hypothetical protein B0O80DRAFT_499806 [Mortierella sp. GBAus27b]|nr:hypothetical protein BGX31_003288 [Mortierella sp. GBA43]KAI8351890.1 hypothetical protein B0O80DRAFT_499806 [Mortierella sp. GBAus27b]
MQVDASHHVFAIPELMALIAEYLSPHEICQWMLTGKTFARQLEPFLWSRLVFTEANQVPMALTRHRHHIQSIQVEEPCVLEHLLDTMANGFPPFLKSVHCHAASASDVVFPRLESLDVSMNGRHLTINRDGFPFMSRLLTVLIRSPNLTQLAIVGVILEQDPDLFQSFLYAVGAQLPCLERLIVKSNKLGLATGFPLMEACLKLPQLIDLQLDFGMDDYPFRIKEHSDAYSPSFSGLLERLHDNNRPKCGGGEPAVSRLKSLMLPEIKKGYPRTFLFPLFSSMIPNVERLVLPKVYEDMDEADQNELEGIITTGCPKLQHLSTLFHWDVCGYYWLINSVLRGCAGLRSFHGLDFDNLVFSSGLDPVLTVLIQHHARTLVEVELLNCGCVDSEDIQSILTTCNNLRIFRVEPHEGFSVWVSFREATLKEWTCCDLTVLQLRLNWMLSVLDGKSNGGIMEDTAQRLYAQIGRLVKLEELGLGHDKSDVTLGSGEAYTTGLTLDHGWLSELAGLKRLRSFQMGGYFWRSMGQLEVEFMDTNWPRLERIAVACDNLEDEVLILPHWSWLKERRPHFAYTRMKRIKS